MNSRDDEGPAPGGAAPESPDAYREALDRLLEGLDVGPAGHDGAPASPEAARAAADVALISRGLHLIAAELAGPAAVASPADATSAAGIVDEPAAATAPVVLAPLGAHGSRADAPRQGGDAPVVPLHGPSAVDGDDEPESRGAAVPWWRRSTSAVLAAAASVVLVIGLAVPAVQNMSGGEDSGGSATAQQAPAAAAGAATVPDAAMAQGRREPGRKVAAKSSKAAAAPAAPQTGAAAADTGAAADSGAAAVDTAASAGAATAASAKTTRAYGGAIFNRLVACARAIVVGEVVRVSSRELTIAIDEYVTGSGAAERTFTVGSSTARFRDGTSPLAAGQRGLFLIPGSRDVQVRAWLGDDVPAGRKEVRAAQAQRESC